MKKLTDKERLDWLQKNKMTVTNTIVGQNPRTAFNWMWSVWNFSFSGRRKTLRAAIDAAIRAEKAAKTRKPQDPKGGKP